MNVISSKKPGLIRRFATGILSVHHIVGSGNRNYRANPGPWLGCHAHVLRPGRYQLL